MEVTPSWDLKTQPALWRVPSRRSSKGPEAGKGSCALGTPGMGAQDRLSIRRRRESLLRQVREPSQLWRDRAAQKGPLRLLQEDRAVRGWMELAVNRLLIYLCPGADLVPGYQGSCCPPLSRGRLVDHPHSVESEPPSPALVSLTGIWHQGWSWAGRAAPAQPNVMHPKGPQESSHSASEPADSGAGG